MMDKKNIQNLASLRRLCTHTLRRSRQLLLSLSQLRSPLCRYKFIMRIWRSRASTSLLLALAVPDLIYTAGRADSRHTYPRGRAPSASTATRARFFDVPPPSFRMFHMCKENCRMASAPAFTARARYWYYMYIYESEQDRRECTYTCAKGERSWGRGVRELRVQAGATLALSALGESLDTLPLRACVSRLGLLRAGRNREPNSAFLFISRALGRLRVLRRAPAPFIISQDFNASEEAKSARRIKGRLVFVQVRWVKCAILE